MDASTEPTVLNDNSFYEAVLDLGRLYSQLFEEEEPSNVDLSNHDTNESEEDEESFDVELDDAEEDFQLGEAEEGFHVELDTRNVPINRAIQGALVRDAILEGVALWLQTGACASCDSAYTPGSPITIIRFPCDHFYCLDCATRMVETSLENAAQFPVRCCPGSPELDMHHQALFPLELWERYQARWMEWSTPNKTFCHVETCSAWIHSDSIKDGIATCIKCEAKTCEKCKAEAHQGEECPEADEATKQVLDMALTNEWQTCFSCRHVVALTQGCNHITCVCGAQFCYACGRKWKTCDCDQWIERNIIDDHEEEHHEAEHNAAIALHEQTIFYRTQVAQHVLENGPCAHADWFDVQRGVFVCHLCDDVDYREYIFECRICHLHACHQCVVDMMEAAGAEWGRRPPPLPPRVQRVRQAVQQAYEAARLQRRPEVAEEDEFDDMPALEPA